MRIWSKHSRPLTPAVVSQQPEKRAKIPTSASVNPETLAMMLELDGNLETHTKLNAAALDLQGFPGAWRVCAPPHHTAEPAHTSSCPQLLAILVFASASLFDPTWQINCSRLMLSGPRGGITLGILAPLGFQLNTMAIKCVVMCLGWVPKSILQVARGTKNSSVHGLSTNGKKV